MSKKSIITQALEKRSPESKKFVSKSMDIVYRVHDLLKEKGWTQKMLAEKLGKRESEVSSMLTQPHNFTLRTLAKLEVALDTELYIPIKRPVRHVTYTLKLKKSPPLTDFSCGSFEKQQDIPDKTYPLAS